MQDDGWKERSFARLIDEGVLQIGDGYRAKNSELGGNGPLFLRAGHVADTHIDFNGVERFRSELVFLLTKLDLNSRCVFCKPLPHLVVRPRPLHRAGITMIVFWP
jgi:hypothetical protein